VVWAMFLLLLSTGVMAEEQQEQVDQAYISQLMADLRSQSFAAVLKAQNALVEIGNPSVPQLRIMLSRSQERMDKTKAIYVLGRIGTEVSVRAMLNAIDDSDPQVRSAIVTAAKNFDPDQAQLAAPLFTEYLISDHPEARATAAEALQAMGIPKVDLAGILADAIRETSGSKRLNAVAELGRLGPDAAHVAPQLLQLVENAEFNEAVLIVEALARIGNEEIHPLVLEMVEPMIMSKDWQTRQEAIRVMQRLKLDGDTMIKPAVILAASGNEEEIAIAGC